MSNGEGVTYTVKELIAMLEEKLVEQIGSIVTRLDKIDAKLDDKISVAQFRDHESRFESFKEKVEGRLSALEIMGASNAGASKTKLWVGNAAVVIAASTVGALLYYVVAGGH